MRRGEEEGGGARCRGSGSGVIFFSSFIVFRGHFVRVGARCRGNGCIKIISSLYLRSVAVTFPFDGDEQQRRRTIYKRKKLVAFLSPLFARLVSISPCLHTLSLSSAPPEVAK